MNFLDLLGEIDGSKSSNSAPAPPTRAPQPTKKEGTGLNGQNNTAAPPKRKAEGDLSQTPNKLPRKDNVKPTSTPSAGMKPEPYRGTSATAASKLSSRPPLKTTTPSKPNSTVSTASMTTAKAPAKGSYAEILARGKAAQPKDIMKIQNKKTEPTLQRGRDRKLPLNAAGPGSGDREIQSAGEGGASVTSKRKAVDYKGTARASSAAPATKSTKPSYTGTAKLRTTGRPGAPAKKEKVRYAGYASWGDDEDDDDSEASSDMEANMFDVDREEEMSARVAKKEDAEELARLNELERQKRVRKEKLEKMAEEKRNKKRVL